jgi:hypothetical protein
LAVLGQTFFEFIESDERWFGSWVGKIAEEEGGGFGGVKPESW